MIKMPPPGHPLRENLDPAQVANYCDPAHVALNDTIEECTEAMVKWMWPDRAVNSVTALCTDPANGEHLLVRVLRDGTTTRLWNFTTGEDYGV